MYIMFTTQVVYHVELIYIHKKKRNRETFLASTYVTTYVSVRIAIVLFKIQCPGLCFILRYCASSSTNTQPFFPHKIFAEKINFSFKYIDAVKGYVSTAINI